MSGHALKPMDRVRLERRVLAWRPLGVAAVAVVTSIVGCANSGTHAGDATVIRDSSGVLIVGNKKPAWTDAGAWRLDSTTPVVLAPERETIEDVVDIFAFADGRIGVASNGAKKVWIFSPSGIQVGSVGRAGRGPGEFEALSRAWAYRGDSILAFEGGRTRRMTLFSADGRVGRTWFASGFDSTARFVIPVGTLESGAAVVRTMNVIVPAPVRRVERPSADVLVVGADWGDYVRISSVADSKRFIGPDALAGELLFTQRPSITTSRKNLFVAAGDTPDIAEYSEAGALVRHITWPARATKVSPDDIDREAGLIVTARRKLFRGAPDDLQKRMIDAGIVELLKIMPRPESYPIIGDLLVDSDDNLWVLPYAGVSDESGIGHSAVVFDSTGRWLGEVTLPARFRPYNVSRGYVTGVRLDSLDVPQVVRFPLVKAR